MGCCYGARAKAARTEDPRKHSVNGYWINPIRWDLGSKAIENGTRICIHTAPRKISAGITMEDGTGTGSSEEHPNGGGSSPQVRKAEGKGIFPGAEWRFCMHQQHEKASGWFLMLSHSVITRSCCRKLTSVLHYHHSAFFQASPSSCY